ncbi:hypothetical protein [Streptomyces sp. NPDC093225]|uniref:hypothetical protein n=1 Tax=Streptomyces sp. NPDC093225 TaxID=3366034 RepID=UPI003818ECCA
MDAFGSVRLTTGLLKDLRLTDRLDVMHKLEKALWFRLEPGRTLSGTTRPVVGHLRDATVLAQESSLGARRLAADWALRTAAAPPLRFGLSGVLAFDVYTVV